MRLVAVPSVLFVITKYNEGVSTCQLCNEGLVWQFACGLQSLDCKMSLEIQQLDTGMAVQGTACCSWEDRGWIFGKHLVHSKHQFLVFFI